MISPTTSSPSLSAVSLTSRRMPSRCACSFPTIRRFSVDPGSREAAMSEIASIAATIFRKARGSSRVMVAVAGAPGAGKTTLAAALAEAINAGGQSAAVVAMDGFHYDDAVLEARGHRSRKGAPHTFDFAGFRALLNRLRTGGEDVAVPVFDRTMELSRAAAAIVPADTRIVLVEG